MNSWFRALCLSTLASAMLLGAAPALAQNAESDAAVACGRKAKDAGLSGKGLVSDFVADCVASMKAGKAEEKASSGDAEKDKAKKEKAEKMKKEKAGSEEMVEKAQKEKADKEKVKKAKTRKVKTKKEKKAK